jgi:hypothetical protein
MAHCILLESFTKKKILDPLRNTGGWLSLRWDPQLNWSLPSELHEGHKLEANSTIIGGSQVIFTIATLPRRPQHHKCHNTRKPTRPQRATNCLGFQQPKRYKFRVQEPKRNHTRTLTLPNLHREIKPMHLMQRQEHKCSNSSLPNSNNKVTKAYGKTMEEEQGRNTHTKNPTI